MAPTVQLGDASEDAHRRVDQLQDEQQQLLAQIRRDIAALPPPDPQHEAGTPQERDQDEKRRQLLRQLAEIEKRINDENARPKKRYISPATREEVYAQYYDALRRKVEDRGTRNFPEAAGHKLYGELTMNVTVDAAGRVVEAEIVRPSDSRVLDQRAVAIVQAASPFGPFTPAMRAQADEIVVTSRFRFTRDDGLEATVGSAK
jgi:protein TonB